VNDMGLDGVDIDYEYFYEDNQNDSGFALGTEAQLFLRDVTVGLREALPDSEITHAPMDSDIVQGTAYYDILNDISYTLDFLMPQYYNGVTRPVVDGLDGSDAYMSVLDHYTDLVDDMFDGDPTKVVFGFCIADCSGTGSNADGEQAAQVMSDLSEYYSCNGGAFFWVSDDDLNAEWSRQVSDVIEPNAGCSHTTQPPYTSPICEDARIPISYLGIEISCAFIVSLDACDIEMAQSHCPNSCNTCLQYGCEDSQAPLSVLGQTLSCVDIQNRFTNEQLEEKCDEFAVLAATCRGACNICEN